MINTLKPNTNSDPSSNITHQEWFEYFKKLMNVNQKDNFSNDDKVIDQFNSDILNDDMTTEEVILALKSLKNNKACGADGVTKEMIKISCSVNTDIYVKLFNLIFKSGIYPIGWRENFIKPIFKGGCFNDLSNYRGVALSSCLGNFFCRILQNRLEKFLEKNDIVCNEQIRFRSGCRTSDHILTLKTIIDY
ncbi:unnamed protein product [Mytilus coruscus]|uniref:Reverse transcriptase domain-containing protein n=1 Tax=Mytilus coruscus TaxID=42192 RepID=A0A6J8DH79_MYTCO|nr:unnamed protein product [Mytilus coruscus]